MAFTSTIVTADKPLSFSHPESQRLPYISQLDGFRFFAVVLVIFSHWIPFTIINKIPNGYIGVTFFFVLSGFLISSNLLYAKKSLTAGKTTLPHALKTFYIRRTLRIFPLYYFVIFLVLAGAPAAFEGHFLWYAAYIPNFYIFNAGHWPGMLSHLWSLGIEEQFYLLWPFLIFLTPWKRLNVLLWGTVAVCLGYRIFLLTLGISPSDWHAVLPLSCFDSFAIGSMFSLFITGTPELAESLLFKIIPWKGFVIAATCCIVAHFAGLYVVTGLFLSIASLYIIVQANRGYSGILKIILDNRGIRYLGKISYGLYIYHNFIPWLLRCLMGKEQRYPLPLPVLMDWSWLHGGLRLFLVEFLILIIIASISWYVLEHPVNRLKRYFVS